MLEVILMSIFSSYFGEKEYVAAYFSTRNLLEYTYVAKNMNEPSTKSDMYIKNIL